VCIGGLVLSPGPTSKQETTEAEFDNAGTSVTVVNFSIRVGNHVIKVEAWRDNVELAMTVKAGSIYVFHSIKKLSPDNKNAASSALRFLKGTSVLDCDEDLRKQISDTTTDTWDGAEHITVLPAGRGKRTPEQYKRDESVWVSASVVGGILCGQELRELQGAVQIPSVTLTVMGEKMTYEACVECKKGVWEGQKSCECSSSETTIRFRADVLLQDNTFQLNAVIFDAMEELVTLFADGEQEKISPAYFHDSPDHIFDFGQFLHATPLTILAVFEENRFNERMEVSIKAAGPTFHNEKVYWRHPMKAILVDKSHFGKTSISPACAMADTSFEAGAGVTLVPGGTAQKFRALLQVMDKEATFDRTIDGAPATKCSRKVKCLMAEENAEVTYTLTAIGCVKFASELNRPRKGEFLHALVSWRSGEEMTLVAFYTIPDKPELATMWREFFSKEVSLHKELLADNDEQHVTSNPKETPCKKHKASMAAATSLASPESW